MGADPYLSDSMRLRGFSIQSMEIVTDAASTWGDTHRGTGFDVSGRRREVALAIRRDLVCEVCAEPIGRTFRVQPTALSRAQSESHTRLKQVLRRRLIHASTRRLTHIARLVNGQGSSAASLPHSAGSPPNIACRRRGKQGKISKAKRVSLVRVVGQRPGCAAHKSDWQPAGDLHLVARHGKSQRANKSAREASAQSVYNVFLGL